MNENTVGARLKTLRIAKNMTRRQVSDTLGKTRTHVYKLENDCYPPSERDVGVLAKLFGVNADYLTPKAPPEPEPEPTETAAGFQLRSRPRERCCVQLYPRTADTVKRLAQANNLSMSETLDQIVEYAVRNMKT